MKSAVLITPYGRKHTLTLNDAGVIQDENGIVFTTHRHEWISGYGALYASNQTGSIMFWHELPLDVQSLFRQLK